MTDQLQRTLNTRDLTLLVVGSVIGSGIFLVPGVVLRQSGGFIGVALLVWVLGGLLSLLGALTYGELAATRPHAGGIYIYIRDAFGAFPAFLYGWSTFLVIAGGAVATLAVAFTAYLRQLVPLSTGVGRLVSILMILVLLIINVRGTRQSANVQNWATAIKVGAILLMSTVLLAAGTGLRAPQLPVWPAELDLGLISQAGVAMLGVLWAYEGWQYPTLSAGEVLEPHRALPRGLAVGTAALIAIYLLANVSYYAALGPARAAQSGSIAAEAVGALFGGAAGKLIAAAILISIFSAANGLTLTAPRVYYAMANDGVFFRRLALVHPRYGTPAFAIVASSLWAMILAATGTFEQLLTYVVFAGWIFYGLAGLSIFVFRRREASAARPFRAPGYPLTPLLFVLASFAIVGNTLVTQPGRAGIGLGIVLLGSPAYLIWRTRSRSA